jgi:4-amino-4-deoxy-L-arabinose transferase-like glycosyltransferase
MAAMSAEASRNDPGGEPRRRSARATFLLAAIVLLAAGLRLALLGSLPPGLHPDEAANALEALSLAETGRSTDGRFLPLVFDHHGVDWVEGVYIWLSVPCVAASGDAIEVAIRLPAALAGTAAVLVTFFLGARLAGTRAGLGAAWLLALEPWAVQHSRFAERASLEPLLLSGGLLAALSGLERGRRSSLVLGGSLLGLAALTYPPARVVVPLVALALLATRGASLRDDLALLLPLAIAGLALAPFALSARGLLRVREIGTTAPLAVLDGYWHHFLPRLYFSGDEGQGFLAKGVSPLYIFEAPLILAGLLAAARAPRLRFLVAWFFIFPLASAFTLPSPNLLRAIFGLPLFALLGALGLESILRRARPSWVALILAPIVGISVFLSASSYRRVFPQTTSAWARYANEREEVARMHGRVQLSKPHERALVELYARRRPHRWWSDTEVELDD